MAKPKLSRSSYNQKSHQEPIVRKNLMNLLAQKYIGKPGSEEWKEWLKESSDPTEGMCVGWSWMFIEKEQEITKLWHDLQDEDPDITEDDKKFYRVLAKKLWYRYINDACELEEEKRVFKKLPIEMDKEDMMLQEVKFGKEDNCRDINKIKDEDELYEKLSKKIISIIDGEDNKKDRHYIKLDNKAHSMVIAFDAFKENKGVITIETACNGVEEIEKKNFKESLKEILRGAFEEKTAINSQFSIETFSRSIESMKVPSVSLSSATGYSLKSKDRSK